MAAGKTYLKVINKNSGELKKLAWDEINDAVTDDQGVVIVFDTNMEPYYLLVDKDLLEE